MKNAAGIEVFNGFQIKYPEYELITPQTLKTFTIRSLTVMEEEKLKGSMLTPSKLAEHLNEVIFSCIIKKPDDIKTFDDFLNKLTIKDRDALMYALYHVTYKDIHNYDVTCSGCEAVNSVKIDFLKSFKATVWDPAAKPVLETEIPVKFDIASNVTAVIKQPRLIDEANLIRQTAFASDEDRDLNMQLLVVNRFELEDSVSKRPDTIEDRANILKGYNQLPSTDRKMIEKAYFEHFGKYGVEVVSKIHCHKCGNEDTITVDLVRQFFRSMYE